MAKEGDTIAFLGKGEETTQDFGYEIIEYSEHEVVRDCLRKKEKEIEKNKNKK